MKFRGLLVSEVEDRWDEVRPLIESGLNASDACLDYDPEDLVETIKTKEMQAWAVFEDEQIKALFISRLIVYPKRKVLEMFLASGSGLFTWANGVFEVMRAYALSNGCTGLKAYGRDGWEALYRDKGKITKSYVMGVEI